MSTPEPLYILGAGHAPLGQVGDETSTEYGVVAARAPRSTRLAWPGGRSSWSPAPNTIRNTANPGFIAGSTFAQKTRLERRPRSVSSYARVRQRFAGACRAPGPISWPVFCDVALVIRRRHHAEGGFSPRSGGET